MHDTMTKAVEVSMPLLSVNRESITPAIAAMIRTDMIQSSFLI
jgi:hypothetical protein